MKLLETLQYVGANRRSDKTGFEHVLALEPAESTAIVSSQQSLPANLATMLQVAGVTGASPEFLQPDSGTSAVAAFAHWFAATTILLQRSAGHDVSLFRVIPGEQDGQQRVWYEYEHSEVGRRAARLALQMIAQVIPELELEDDLAGERGENAKLFTEFTQYAAKQALPADTKAIINACARLDVPCLKLDRDPYEGVSGDFRIRKHGLLKLGHSEYQHIVDGTVCIDRSDSDSPLLHDRDAIFRKLTELDMPVAAQDREFRNCNTAARAARSARRIGYPVVVKPNIRGAGGITLDISAADSLATAVHAAQESGRQVIVEKFITGDSWKLIIAGGALIAVIAGLPVKTPLRPHTPPYMTYPRN